MQKTILLLAANPINSERLRLDQEAREISEALQRAKLRDEFLLKQQWAVRPKDLRRALLDYEPEIVHFLGHGIDDKGICLEDDAGRMLPMGGDELADVFSLFEKTDCVLLNACYSASQAEEISKHVRYVIGIDRSITDRSAIELATAFYDALGSGRDYQTAYRFMCAFRHVGESQVGSKPVLLVRSHQNTERTLGQNSSAMLSTNPPPSDSGSDQTEDSILPLGMSGKSIEASLEFLLDETVFDKLKALLNDYQWREADLETYRVLMKVGERMNYLRLRPQDIASLPSTAIHIIDDLWASVSHNKFGFSAQLRVWQTVAKPSNEFSQRHFRLFANRIGWRVDEKWLDYNDLTFSLAASAGYLPSLRWPSREHDVGWWPIWREQTQRLIAHVSSLLS